jgi:hypothetical protein
MWTNASERRPTEADALDGHVVWRASKDDPTFVGRWDIPFATYEWRSPLKKPELPQLGQDIWVRKFDEETWRSETLLRWKAYPVTASRSGENEIVWHEWSLTDPNEPPEPQYRPFANAEEFWPFRNCWWRNNKSPESRPPCPFTCDRYGGWSWQACFEKMELLEDVDGKMAARPFGLEVSNE